MDPAKVIFNLLILMIVIDSNKTELNTKNVEVVKDVAEVFINLLEFDAIKLK